MIGGSIRHRLATRSSTSLSLASCGVEGGVVVGSCSYLPEGLPMASHDGAHCDRDLDELAMLAGSAEHCSESLVENTSGVESRMYRSYCMRPLLAVVSGDVYAFLDSISPAASYQLT